MNCIIVLVNSNSAMVTIFKHFGIGWSDLSMFLSTYWILWFVVRASSNFTPPRLVTSRLLQRLQLRTRMFTKTLIYPRNLIKKESRYNRTVDRVRVTPICLVSDKFSTQNKLQTWLNLLRQNRVPHQNGRCKRHQILANDCLGNFEKNIRIAMAFWDFIQLVQEA